MRIAPATVCLAALVMAMPLPAQGAACTVENRLGLRVVDCDEDPATTNEAMARAQAACKTLVVEDQPACNEAVAEAFALRRESMIRRFLRVGASWDSIASRLGATTEEIQKVEAHMALTSSSVDPEAQARAAEELRAIEQQLEEWKLQQEGAY